MLTLDDARRRLMAERDRLLSLQDAAHHLATISEEQPRLAPEQLDHTAFDLAVETFEMEKDAAIARRVDEDVIELEAALARLDAGDYGVCETCRQPIAEERLLAVPAARRCAQDQAAADRVRR